MATYTYLPGFTVGNSDYTVLDDIWNISGWAILPVWGSINGDTGNDQVLADYFSYTTINMDEGADIVNLLNSNGGDIYLGIGHDQLEVESSQIGNIYLADTGTGGGSSHDEVSITDSSFGDIHAGYGSDLIEITNSWGTGSILDMHPNLATGIGDTLTMTDSGILDDIVGGAGNDDITISGVYNDSTNSGYGNDGVSVSGHIYGGAGDDIVRLYNTAVKLDVHLGEGTNTLVQVNTSLRGINGGDGDDTILMYNGSSAKYIKTNDGSNTVTISGSTVDNLVRTGKDDDVLTIRNNSNVGNIQTRAGDDIISISQSNTGYIFDNGGQSVIDITGFSRIQQFIVTAGKADTISVNTSYINGYIDSGRGDDTINLTYAGLYSSGVQAGDGDDTINIFNVFSGQNFGDDVLIAGGEGSDTFNVTGFDFQSFTIDGGDSVGDYDVLDLSTIVGLMSVTYTSADKEDGYVTYTTDTGEVTTITFTEMEDVVTPCFTEGTYITTKKGEMRVDELIVGDLVLTADRGYQPIRWIDCTKVSGTGKNAPVMIKSGALGNTRDLLVSPCHRMLISDWRAKVMFDMQEVLIPAKALTFHDRIFVQPQDEVSYFHILFDRHEIIFSEGTPSESLYIGDQHTDRFAREARDEILRLFPQLSDYSPDYGPPVRQPLSPSEGQLVKSLCVNFQGYFLDHNHCDMRD